MTAWVIVGGVAAGLLALTILALLTSAVVRRRRPSPPDWVLPTPAEMRGTQFPIRFQGYGPQHVDVALVSILEAYEELYLAAGPAAIARARARLSERHGITPDVLEAPADAP